MTDQPDIAAIAIGRNEGERLVACLRSLQGRVARIVYVDSGSTDGSVEAAKALGAEVVDLDLSIPFTAARARNAGFAHLAASGRPPALVQFLDGDCALQPGWLAAAVTHLEGHSKAALVCGRRRERFPDASIYNALIDREWDGAPGQVKACGGDALFRTEAFEAVGGFDPNLIAGEEPELCVRLRAGGWQIWRLDAEMTLHDAALTRFSQWWKRAKRAGFAYAQGFAMHGAPPENHKKAELRRALGWGVVLPLLTVLAAAMSPWGAVLLLMVWPLQMLRLLGKGHPRAEAVFLTLAKLPEGQGALTFYLRRLRGGEARIIEYK